jgi:hypothetical protein
MKNIFLLTALLPLAGCNAGSLATGATALSSPAGQLFCAIDTGGGGQIIAGLIDADATAKLGAAAPIAVVATNATAAAVQADCAAAAQAVGGKAGVPVSPPPSTATVATVAIHGATP